MMMSAKEVRTERLVAFFTERGYQPILIAKSNLIPPDVYLLGEDRYRRLGPLRDLLNWKAPELELVETHGGEARLSFNFFSKLLEQFGLTGSPKGSAKASLAGRGDFRNLESGRFQFESMSTKGQIRICDNRNTSRDITRRRRAMRMADRI
jgi:hypothetical protein